MSDPIYLKTCPLCAEAYKIRGEVCHECTHEQQADHSTAARAAADDLEEVGTIETFDLDKAAGIIESHFKRLLEKVTGDCEAWNRAANEYKKERDALRAELAAEKAISVGRLKVLNEKAAEARRESIRAENLEGALDAEKARADKLEAMLVARHGGEPLAELDEARDQLVRSKSVQRREALQRGESNDGTSSL